jgi:hypothetical protein
MTRRVPTILHDPLQSAQPLFVLTLVTPAPSLDAMNRRSDHDFIVNLRCDKGDIHRWSFFSSRTENKPIVSSRARYTI